MVLQDSESEVVVGELEERVDDAVVEALFGRVVEESDEQREAAVLAQLHPVGRSGSNSATYLKSKWSKLKEPRL